MLVLALDTTTRAGSIAVVRAGDLLHRHAGDGSRPHAERLPGDLVAALGRAGLGLPEVDVFAVAVGPGSFTGLRIGIAVMQGCALPGRLGGGGADGVRVALRPGPPVWCIGP